MTFAVTPTAFPEVHQEICDSPLGTPVGRAAAAATLTDCAAGPLPTFKLC